HNRCSTAFYPRLEWSWRVLPRPLAIFSVCARNRSPIFSAHTVYEGDKTAFRYQTAQQCRRGPPLMQYKRAQEAPLGYPRQPAHDTEQAEEQTGYCEKSQPLRPGRMLLAVAQAPCSKTDHKQKRTPGDDDPARLRKPDPIFARLQRHPPTEPRPAHAHENPQN